VFEIITFRLADGVDPAVFRTVDGRVQVEFAYQQPGLLRRTLGRRDQTWLVLQIWTTSEAAHAASVAFDATPSGREFLALIDRDSLVVDRYEGVD
jgi:hypothetical protein